MHNFQTTGLRRNLAKPVDIISINNFSLWNPGSKNLTNGCQLVLGSCASDVKVKIVSSMIFFLVNIKALSLYYPTVRLQMLLNTDSMDKLVGTVGSFIQSVAVFCGAVCVQILKPQFCKILSGRFFCRTSESH